MNICWKSYNFKPVIHLPKDVKVLDLSSVYVDKLDSGKPDSNGLDDDYEFSIGRYNEIRSGMYTQDMYQGLRNVHMGIDIGAPAGTSIYCFYDGIIFDFCYHPRDGDYGYTIITKHALGDSNIYALHGHLSQESLQNKEKGKSIKAGEQIASVGDTSENGGWNPHLHFQLSLSEPKNCDMPGVVSQADREWALNEFPDPKFVLNIESYF